MVGKLGGEKQIGQLYDARGSARDTFGRTESGGGATAGSGSGSATGLGLRFGAEGCEESDADGSMWIETSISASCCAEADSASIVSTSFLGPIDCPTCVSDSVTWELSALSFSTGVAAMSVR